MKKLINYLINIIYNKICIYVQHYDYKKYWKRRAIVINPSDTTPLFIKLYYLYYIKKIDAYHGCSFGTLLNKGSIFDTPPNLPHGPKGIILGNNLHFGDGCTLFHHVTIASGGCKIGKNVLFSTGSTVISKVKSIGNNVKIGANCVVIEDIPDNATVVMQKPRIIMRECSNEQ